MRILIYSPAFFPSIGGLEMMVYLMAKELTKRGHRVTVFTNTLAGDADTYDFQVIRSGNGWKLLKAVTWCQVCLQFNVSLKGLWPFALVRRAYVVSHQGIYARANNRPGLRDALKYWVSHIAVNIALSRYVANHLQGDVKVIPNSYNSEVFFPRDDVARERDLVFAGRLVNDKGVDDLLYAIAELNRRGFSPNLSIIGDGPERKKLEVLSASLGLGPQVSFLGARRGAELAALLNSHRVLVVPSRWAEPFGIVALEGIACGCVVVGSELGGLPEAIGPCGLTYPNGDRAILASRIEQVLLDSRLYADLRSHATVHLQKHIPEVIADEFETVLVRAARH